MAPTATDFLAECDALTHKSCSQILREARELLSDPDLWTSHAWARDSEGYRVDSTDPTAVRWDVEGATALASNEFGINPPKVIKALDRAVMILTGEDLGVNYYTDNNGYETVMKMLDLAIEVEELRSGRSK